MVMDEKKANKIIDECGNFVVFTLNCYKEVNLDGYFGIKELEAIIFLLKKYTKENKLKRGEENER